MSREARPLITPLNEEQRRKQEDLQKRIRDAEFSKVGEILAAARTPAGLAELIKNASEFAESATKKIRHPESPPVACKQGCYWCCYQNVLVSAPEAFRIARFVTSEMTAEIRSKVLDDLRRLHTTARGSTPAQRARLHVPCACLRDGSCSIYAVRPLACAEFTSFNVDDCKRAERVGFPMGSVIHEKARLIAYQAVQQGLFDGLRQSLPETDSQPLELTAAVVAALDMPDAEKRWLEGGEVFAGAHLARNPDN